MTKEEQTTHDILRELELSGMEHQDAQDYLGVATKSFLRKILKRMIVLEEELSHKQDKVFDNNSPA